MTDPMTTDLFGFLVVPNGDLLIAGVTLSGIVVTWLLGIYAAMVTKKLAQEWPARRALEEEKHKCFVNLLSATKSSDSVLRTELTKARRLFADEKDLVNLIDQLMEMSSDISNGVERDEILGKIMCFAAKKLNLVSTCSPSEIRKSFI